MGAVLSHPLSRGTVHVASTSPTNHPLVDPKFLSHPSDLSVITKVVQTGLRLTRTPPFGDIIKGMMFPPPQMVGGGDVHVLPLNETRWEEDEEKVKMWTQMAAITVFHPVGTAAMGTREKGGVVDGELKVWGTGNVRVVDASVIPLVSAFCLCCVREDLGI